MFKYLSEEISNIYKYNKKIEKGRAMIICVTDKAGKNLYPHPLTHFINKYYHSNGGSINTELAPINILIPFLNYVIDQINRKNSKFINVRGIADLTNEHVSCYLKYCIEEKGNLQKTIDRKIMYLSKFYKYLDSEGILNRKPIFESIIKIKDEKVYKSYRLDVNIPKVDEEKIRRKIKRKDIISSEDQWNCSNNSIRRRKIYELLSLSEEITPEITFGVALQIFAGLRRGEVVNLLRKSIKPQNGYKYGENGLIIKIRDNRKILFGRLSSNSCQGVKRVRDQACIIDSMLCYYYKKHLENVLTKYTDVENKNALFYDKKGQPMSGDIYYRRFIKLKNAYLGKLLNTPGRKNDYDDFEETVWGTHIGRGIFTNICHDAGFTVQQTAILRGDKTTEAMQSYFDIITATHDIAKALDFLSPTENYDKFEKEELKY